MSVGPSAVRVRNPLLSTPLLPVPDREPQKSRRVAQRQEEGRRAAITANRAIERLTALGGWSKEGKGRPSWREAGKRDQEEAYRLEREAVEFVRREREGRRAARDAGSNLSDGDAFRRLVKEGNSYGGAERGAIARTVVGQVDLPVTASKLAVCDGAEIVQAVFAEPDELLFVESSPLREEVESSGSFMDPNLRKPENMAKLVVRMLKAGMAKGIQQKRCAHGISLFTVVKKGDRLRLVFDMRRVNRYFKKAPRCAFASLEAVAGLDFSAVDAGEVAVGFAGDVPDYFYRLELPAWMAEWLWIDEVDMDAVRAELQAQGESTGALDGCTGIGMVCPPMGWAWSPWIAQESLQWVVEQVQEPGPLTSGGRMVHGQPAPIVDGPPEAGPPHWQLIDDYGGILVGDHSAEEAQAFGDSVRSALKANGLDAHKEQIGRALVVLGGDVDLRARAVYPKSDKFALLLAATRFVCRRGSCSGRALGRLLGRWQWFLLLRRELFSVLDNVYGSVQDRWDDSAERELPADVRSELKTLLDLAMFVKADLAAPWDEEVLMTDASGDGYGVVSAHFEQADVRELGRAARASPIQPIPEWALQRRWKLAMRGRWKQGDSQNVLECRAGTLAQLHFTRRRDFRNRKALVITDSQVGIGVKRKGRSSSPALLLQARRQAAIACFCLVRIVYRWVPTEWNLGDGPSRGALKPSVGADSNLKAVARGRRPIAEIMADVPGFANDVEESPPQVDAECCHGVSGARSEAPARTSLHTGAGFLPSARPGVALRGNAAGAEDATSRPADHVHRLGVATVHARTSAHTGARFLPGARPGVALRGTAAAVEAVASLPADATRGQASAAPAPPGSRRQRGCAVQGRGPAALEAVATREPTDSPWLLANQLATHAVADSTLTMYADSIAEFQHWAGERFGQGDRLEADQLVADYMSYQCYVEEEPSWHGGRLLSALQHFYPRLGTLPEAKRAEKAWRKLFPGGERSPIAAELVGAVVLQMIQANNDESADLVWIVFDGLCRSQDWENLRFADVADDGQNVSMEFGVRARGERSKTGHGQGVVLNTALGREILRARKRAAQEAGVPEDSHVFSVRAPRFREDLTRAVQELDLPYTLVTAIVPHVLRHAGAAELVLRQRWNVSDIKVRGRWDSDKSLKRYTKPHLVVQMLAALPGSVRAVGQGFLRDPLASVLRARAQRGAPAPR